MLFFHHLKLPLRVSNNLLILCLPLSRNRKNRDRLELYALYKQALSGDAPAVLSTQTSGERAKYAAWKAKAGISQVEAMRMYIQESDRQVRVYGLTPQTPENTPAIEQQPSGSPAHQPQPRGLAAIPLLCAAASESREAYLRRLASTRLEQAWWGRQEPLCATPGSILALPETVVIKVAALVEYVSLTAEGTLPLPHAVVQSFFWPLHNVLLALWMGIILVYTAWTAAFELLQTVLWGSRRTGLSLPGVWKDQVIFSQQSVHTLTESHQPLSARIVGLCLLPYTVVVAVTSGPPALWASLLYCAAMALTWWYWVFTLPFFALCLLGSALLAGNCFAVIELAGV